MASPIPCSAHKTMVWAGDPRKQLPNAHLIDRQRSVAFDMLAPLFDVAECTFVNLQKGEDAVTQLRNSPLRHRVIDWSDDFHDFSDTAALVDNLDLVIKVDTSVAHLAGARQAIVAAQSLQYLLALAAQS